MEILSTTGDTTGAWFRVEHPGDVIITQRDSDSMGGGTLYIDIANTAKQIIEPDTGLTFTAVMTPQVVTVCKGWYIRGRTSGVSGGSIHVSVDSATTAGPAISAV